MRRKGDADADLREDLDRVEGRVYLVKMTQMIYDGAQDPVLVPGTHAQIKNMHSHDPIDDVEEYPGAVIAYTADFYALKSNRFDYIENLDLIDDNEDGDPDSVSPCFRAISESDANFKPLLPYRCSPLFLRCAAGEASLGGVDGGDGNHGDSSHPACFRDRSGAGRMENQPNKVRASRQAKASLEQMSRDFEAMVVRTGLISSGSTRKPIRMIPDRMIMRVRMRPGS